MRTYTFTREGHRRRQRGAVLGIALLLLSILTILAVAASQMARSRGMSMAAIQEREIAFQSAEAALRAAERLTSISDTVEPCTTTRCRVYPEGVADAADHRALAWWLEHAWAYTQTDTWTPAAASEATAYSMFIVEKLADVPDSMASSSSGTPTGQTFYRATALARPRADTAPIILQSTFARNFE